MAMTSKTRDPGVMIDMNMTPLIDVMLVLIIMLIITIPIQNHSLNLNLPVSTAKPDNSMHPVTLDIDFDGTLYWNGTQLSREAVDSKLNQLGAIPVANQAELHIKPNRLVNYKTVAGVLASAQRSKVVHLGMVGNEQFM